MEIYLDMDGVLADFEAAVAAHGVPRSASDASFIHLPPEDWTPEQHERDACVHAVMERTSFWPSIPVMPGAMTLLLAAISLVGEENVYILTATPRRTEFRERCAKQKTAWAFQNLGFAPSHVITCLRSEKRTYAGPGKILVDDLQANCAEWTTAGGEAIWFESSGYAIAHLRKMVRELQPRTETEQRADAALAAMRLTSDSDARKRMPMTTGLLDYFPDALAAVAELSFKGNEKHNPGQPLHWSRGQSNDHADCIPRHLVDRGSFDADGTRHSAALAWRSLALLQTEIEAERGLSPSRGSR